MSNVISQDREMLIQAAVVKFLKKTKQANF